MPAANKPIPDEEAADERMNASEQSASAEQQPLTISITHDQAINYAFQQNAIPIVKELRIKNGNEARKSLLVRISSEPEFLVPAEIRLQSLDALGEHRVAPLDLKLRPDFLKTLNEKVSGLFRVEVCLASNNGEPPETLHSISESVSLLAHNEWCGLVALPEILAAFVLPNDPAVMRLLSRASELLHASTGRSDLNGYQDKNRTRAWEQVAAIYKAIAELNIRYIVPPASFENTGQKVRFPSDIIEQRFATCLDLVLLFSACCEQSGLHPFILMHQGHAYAGCWLEERTLPEPCIDDLQHIRKLATDSLITVFETTLLTGESPSNLTDAERLAKPHLETQVPFRVALDVRSARQSKIRPLPIPGQAASVGSETGTRLNVEIHTGIGSRSIPEPIVPGETQVTPGNRIDQWKARLLDLSLRNRLLNFKATKSTIPILSAVPEQVEDHLAADAELSLHPRPRLLSEEDPRNRETYTRQQRADALAEHLKDELKHRRLHTGLDDSEHSVRLTELYRAARLAIEENGTNTLFAAVGVLEWRETEHSDRIHRAPLLLVPVELKRRSVLEGFSLRRIDEETRLNVTLMEMLRQQFHKEIPGLDPLPVDESGVDVSRVFQLFRDAVRELSGWEVKPEIWLGQFSFTKFLLWKDLADRLDALTKNRVVNHLVNQAGMPYPNPPEDILPPHLDDQFHPREVYCPRSVDSSQLAAVLAAAAGHDFVLEGPPGTGKSQTIANIIAHCLAHGKRVLFVAEKRAALDVVHRRLREEGLEPFCLELHSNKTGKGDVLAQFERSLKFIDEGQQVDWEVSADKLEKARFELNAYVRALHRQCPCGLSAYQCFDYLLPRKNEMTVPLDWQSILQTPADTLARARDLARLFQERSRAVLPLADHPLAPMRCEEWSPGWAERTLQQIQQVKACAEQASGPTHDFRKWLGFSAPNASRVELINLSKLAGILLAPEPVGSAFATTPWNQLSSELKEWIRLSRERTELRNKLRPVFEAEPPNGMSQSTTPLPCETWGSSAAEKLFVKLREFSTLTRTATEASRELQKWLQFSGVSVNRAALVHRVLLVDCLSTTPPVPAPFATANWNEFVPFLDNLIALTSERANLRRALEKYEEAKLLALDLNELDQCWRSAQKTWFLPKLLKTSRVRKALRPARRDANRPEVTELTEVLQSSLRLRAINKSLADVASVAETHLGLIWQQGEPSPENLKQLRSWGENLHESFRKCAGEDATCLQQLKQVVGDLFKAGPASFGPGTDEGNRLNRYRDAVSAFDDLYTQLEHEVHWRRKTLDEAPDHLGAVATATATVLQSAPRLLAIDQDLNTAATTAAASLGVLWKKGEPNADELEKALHWGELLHAAMVACCGDDIAQVGKIRQLLGSLFTEGIATYSPGTPIHTRLTSHRDAFLKFDAALEPMATAIRLERSCIDQATDHLSATVALCERLGTGWNAVRHWCSWQKVRQEGVRLGLSPIIEKLESPEGTKLDVSQFFERCYRRALLFAVIEGEGVLRDFFGREHAERIERFRDLDEHMAKLTRALIRARLSANIPRERVHDDIPKEELGLLRKEIGKKARHIPVRQLLNRIPKLLPKLKPCVLMSPLSVAQYLEPSHDTFDVVIFDEASQIPVWDAVGAIARGAQLIVVGDPKQLPPTNFFNSTDDGDEDPTDINLQQDLESILDELMANRVRHKRLRWHYRSRHEGLIAFSNRHYYDNDLLTFPAPKTDAGGVRLKHLPEARYDKGKSRTNAVEARALVEELVSRLRTKDGPPRSFGVVTFNQAQQQLIEDLLDEKRREFPEIERHFGDEPPVEGEPVFVKNLENVQGDERDVILFSICYGPDESGRISMNFGPLNRDGGERRLNVAITRAKHEVAVFSGLRGDHIDLTRTRARGARDLKYFLEYAERGPKAFASELSVTGGAEAESEFERLVAERIRAAGYDVHHQVGCSGYRVDLGVVDPKAAGRYLLGVECDGATYHRAATARDRDKLRQAVLEGLGWELHRIWSTDWWHDADGETKRLIAAIEANRMTA